MTCLRCAEAPPAPYVDEGIGVAGHHEADSPVESAVRLTDSTAGGSAQREYERRAIGRQERIRARHPRIGGLLLALVDDPATTKVWAQGAGGERAVGLTLAGLEGDHVAVLHDRAMPRTDGRPSRANIDHIVVAADGVWVIDAKTHKGGLEVRRSGGFLRPVEERLFIAGRDRTDLVAGVQGQAEAVRRTLEAAGVTAPVRAMLTFVGTELPWLDESIDGVPLRGRRGMAKLLRRPGTFSRDDRRRIAVAIATRLPPARA